MALAYLFDPNKQFQDLNGVNNVAGFLRVYYEGTDDRATTYKNFIGTLNPADIPIDNYGRAVVIVEDEKTYRLEVYSRNGNLMWTQHPLCALVGGGGSFDQVQSNWDEDDPTSAAFIKNKPDIDNGRIHRLRPARDEVIGETSNYDGWVLDLESPNESAPGGYDRLTPQRLKQILDKGEFLVLETYQSGDYTPLALQALVTVQNENPLQISVDFVRQYVSYNILEFERMQIYTPSGEESYLQIRGLGPNSSWWQDKEALAVNGDGRNVTATFTEAQTRANIGTGEKLSVIFGKVKKWFTDLASVAFSGSYNDLSDKPSIPAAQVNSDWNANSGVAQILNKPSLSAVATSGEYNDLSNKPSIPDDAGLVHKSGAETITGIKTFNNDVSPRQTGSTFSKQSKVFECSVIKPYAEWSAEEKDNNHFRLWSIDVTSVVEVASTHCNIVVKLMGSYYINPGNGALRKEITCQIHKGNVIISKEDYTVAQSPCADEFAISGIIKSGDNYLLQVINRNSTANNYPLRLEIEVFNKNVSVLDDVTMTESITEGLPGWAVDVAQVTSNGSPVLTEETVAKYIDSLTTNVNQTDTNVDTSSFTFVNGHIYHLYLYLEATTLRINTTSSGTGYLVVYIGSSSSQSHYSKPQVVTIANGSIQPGGYTVPIDWKAADIVDSSDNKLHVSVIFNGTEYSFASGSTYQLRLNGTDFDGA